MKAFILLCLFLFCPLVLIVAQENKDYEKQGAKLVKKMNRQIMESDLQHTVTTNKISFLGDDTGNHGFRSYVGAMDGVVTGSLAKHYAYQNYYHGKRDIQQMMTRQDLFHI